MRGSMARRAVVGALLALPWLSVAPAVPAQDATGCTPEGGDIVCVWEGDLALGPGWEPGNGEACLRAARLPARGATVAEHAFLVPFPARIEARIETSQGLNDLLLFLDGPGGTINRSYVNEPAQVFHRLAEPGELVLRARVDTTGSRESGDPYAGVPWAATLPERYRLEARITPQAPAHAAFRTEALPFEDDGAVYRRHHVACGAVARYWALPVDGPSLVVFDPDIPQPTFSAVAPDGSYHLWLIDAAGTVLADLRAGPELGTFGLVAGDGVAWGDWYVHLFLDDRMGVEDPYNLPVAAEVRPLPGPLRAPAPWVPLEPLVVDPSGDANDAALDALAGWFSHETADSLAFHVLLAEVPPGGLAPQDGGARRYEAGWRYAGSRVTLTHDPAPGDEGFFNASVADGDTLSLSRISGTVTPGRPGVLTFSAPKAFLGSPAAGRDLEGVAVATYRAEGEPFHAVPGLPGPLGGFVLADSTTGDATFALRGGDAGAVPGTLLRPSSASAAGPWGSLGLVNGLVGAASAVAAGAVAAAAMLQRRRG